MSLSYPWEVFFTATHGLASGTGRIQERLENTGSYLVGRVRPPLSMPDEIQQKADSIMDRITCIPAKGDEGTLAATCRQLSDDDARKIAQDVVSVFDEICKLYGAEIAKSDAAFLEYQRNTKS